MIAWFQRKQTRAFTIKKSTNRLVSLFLVIALIMCCISPLSVRAQEEDLITLWGVKYQVREDGYAYVVGYDMSQITDGKIYCYSPVRDANKNKYVIKGVDDNIFQGGCAHSVTIYMYTDMSIGKESFADMTISTLYGEEGMNGGAGIVFYNLGKVCLSEIGESAFENTKIYGGFSVTATIGAVRAKAFKGMYLQSDFNLKGAIGTIEKYAFQDSRFARFFELTEDVKRIEKGAFSGCNFEEFDLPDEVEYLGSDIFEGCEYLEKIILPKGNKIKEVEKDTFPDIAESVIWIPEEVTDISPYHFENYQNLRFHFPEGTEQDDAILQQIKKNNFAYQIGNGAFIEPELTETPQASEAPELTETPQASEAPELTETPQVSEVPELTETPQVSEVPELTETPQVSEAPELTETPQISEAPKLTETPQASEEPELTETPQASEAPELTETPQASEAPELTETPQVSEEPELTKMPQTSEEPVPTKETGGQKVTEEKQNLQIGDFIYYRNYKYQYLGRKNVAFAGTKKKSAKQIDIPAFLNYQGTKYQVISIKQRACYKMNTLEKVTIGKNVKIIEKEAFSNCNRLKEIVFGENVAQLQQKVLFRCGKVRKVSFLGKRLKRIGKRTFLGVPKAAAFIVPKVKRRKYAELINKAG